MKTQNLEDAGLEGGEGASMASSGSTGLAAPEVGDTVEASLTETVSEEQVNDRAQKVLSDHLLHGEKELMKIFHRISSGFSMDDSTFKYNKKNSKKAGTLRHVGFFDLDVPMTYTLETTYRKFINDLHLGWFHSSI